MEHVFGTRREHGSNSDTFQAFRIAFSLANPRPRDVIRCDFYTPGRIFFGIYLFREDSLRSIFETPLTRWILLYFSYPQYVLISPQYFLRKHSMGKGIQIEQKNGAGGSTWCFYSILESFVLFLMRRGKSKRHEQKTEFFRIKSPPRSNKDP